MSHTSDPALVSSQPPRPQPEGSGPGGLPAGRGPLVVLGIGNILLSDDGLGTAVAEALQEDPRLPADTDVIDGGTGGLSLLPLIAGARALVIVDAVDLDAPPGTIHVLTDDQIGDAYHGHLTAHQVGAADLIAAARLTGVLPAAVALIGVQPATLGTGVGLSPAVTAALPQTVAEVRQWCHRLDAGVPVQPRRPGTV